MIKTYNCPIDKTTGTKIALELNHDDFGKGIITSIDTSGTVNIKWLDSNLSSKMNLPNLYEELDVKKDKYNYKGIDNSEYIHSRLTNIYNDFCRSAEYKYNSQGLAVLKSSVKFKSDVAFSEWKQEKVGPVSRALNIDFKSEEDRIACIAFIAAASPNLEARVYEGESLDNFLEEFPGAPYTLETCETAMVRASNYRIVFPEFKKIENLIPESLINGSNPQNHSIISRTDFLRDLLYDFNFNFGNQQDINDILKAMNKTMYFDLFVDKYKEYSNELEKIGYIKRFEPKTNEKDFNNVLKAAKAKSTSKEINNKTNHRNTINLSNERSK